MRKVLRAVSSLCLLLTSSYGAAAKPEPLDAQIDAWTECTVSSTLTMSKASARDDDVRTGVMRICAPHQAKLKAAAQAKYPKMTGSQLKEMVRAVRSAQEQSVAIILNELRAAQPGTP